jgi:MFS family permease
VGEAAATALAALVACLAGSPAWLWVTFGLLGVAIAAGSVSGPNIILEFCAPEDRPTYIGLTNTILAPVATLGPIIGGWLATWAGYRVMFGGAACLALAGGVLMAIWVREPRHTAGEEADLSAA